MSEVQTGNGNGNGHEPLMPLSALSAPSDVSDELHKAAEIRSAASVILDRIQFMRQAGITFNGRRDLYEVLGYARILTFREFRDRYARGGITGRIVDVYPNATWRGEMWLEENDDVEKDTPFEAAWNELATRLQIIAKLRRADILTGLSTYAAILIGAPGDLSTPLPKATRGSKSLLYLSAFSGGGGPGGDSNGRSMALDADCTIASFDVDTQSERFGLPLTYRLKRTSLNTPQLQREVHWTRILHFAENCVFDDVYGQPRLERVWNLLDDLDKITGGGAEAFWLRANQGLHLDIDKDMALPAAQDAVAKLKEQSEEYKNGMTRWLRTRGVQVNTLGSDVANFQNPADAVLTQIAGALAIPKRILTGSEMGELASSQDRDNWKDQINGRQTNYAGPYIVRVLVNRLIEFGYLPMPVKGIEGYEVKWPHIQTLTEQEKAEGAAKWASVNSTYGGTVFTADEIRDKWYGFGPGSNDDTEPWKAALALKMAQTNKTEGAVVFTDDEIRKVCYGWTPLTPEEKIPITAPERVSATAPTPGVDTPVVPPTPTLTTASGYGEPRGLEDRKFASTQVQLPQDLGDDLRNFRIADDDLTPDGRETDAHVTVKFGLHTQKPEDVRKVVNDFGPVRLTLGQTDYFGTPDYDVVFVKVDSPDLVRLNALLSNALRVTDTHPTYQPHATIAYVKPGRGKEYAGLSQFVGRRVTADAITFCDVNHLDTSIDLGRPPLAAAAKDLEALLGIPSDDVHETLAALEAAIERDDTVAISRIIGLHEPTTTPNVAPHVTVNMPEQRQVEPPTVLVNVQQPPAPKTLSSRVEYETDENSPNFGKIVRIVKEAAEGEPNV